MILASQRSKRYSTFYHVIHTATTTSQAFIPLQDIKWHIMFCSELHIWTNHWPLNSSEWFWRELFCSPVKLFIVKQSWFTILSSTDVIHYLKPSFYFIFVFTFLFVYLKSEFYGILWNFYQTNLFSIAIAGKLSNFGNSLLPVCPCFWNTFNVLYYMYF